MTSVPSYFVLYRPWMANGNLGHRHFKGPFQRKENAADYARNMRQYCSRNKVIAVVEQVAEADEWTAELLLADKRETGDCHECGEPGGQLTYTGRYLCPECLDEQLAALNS